MSHSSALRHVSSHALDHTIPERDGGAARTRPAGRVVRRWAALLAVAGWACADAPTATTGAPPASLDATKFWEALATTRWNRLATDYLQSLPAGTPSNGQAWASRMLTYLSLAQHRAVLAATTPSDRRAHASVSAAVTRASYEVLRSFFSSAPGVPSAARDRIVADLSQQLVAARSAPRWPGAANQDVALGEQIGAAVAQDVIARSSLDGYLSLPAPTPPSGAQYWYATGSIVRSLWGARPFFLGPDELLLAQAPPAWGSDAFRAALDEVYAIVSARTQEQYDIALKWNKVAPAGPFTAGEWNRTADDLIVSQHRTEAEAARILAYANAAAWDAQIVCFTTKFHWWVPRPAQVDGRIFPLLAFTTPNHPSYPSGHSCISSAFGAVLSDAFPSARAWLDAQVEEAGLSRIYAGIHYRFDVEAGRQVGRFAATAARAGSLD